MYLLKKGQPPIEIVDGPMAGHKFVPGVKYTEIPEHEKHRFEKKKPSGPVKSSKAKEAVKNA